MAADTKYGMTWPPKHEPHEAPISSLTFIVDVWTDDGNHVEQVLAAAANATVATAAYEAAIKVRPHKIVTLRQRALEMAKHVPDGLPRKGNTP
jgi:hypothetical protein